MRSMIPVSLQKMLLYLFVGIVYWANAQSTTIPSNEPNEVHSSYSYGDLSFTYTSIPSTSQSSMSSPTTSPSPLAPLISTPPNTFPASPVRWSYNNSACQTCYSIYFTIGLNFLFEYFTANYSAMFVSQMMSLIDYPPSWTLEQKQKYFQIYQVVNSQGSVIINGTMYFLDGTYMDNTIANYHRAISSKTHFTNFSISFLGFAYSRPVFVTDSSYQTDGGNSTINYSNSSECINLTSANCTIVLPQESSSSSKTIIIVAACSGGGVLLIVGVMVGYFCWWKKRLIQQAENVQFKQNDLNDEKQNEKEREKRSLRSSQVLRSYDQRSSRGYFGQNLAFDPI